MSNNSSEEEKKEFERNFFNVKKYPVKYLNIMGVLSGIVLYVILKDYGINKIYCILAGVGFYIVFGFISSLIFRKYGDIKIAKLSGTALILILCMAVFIGIILFSVIDTMK